MLIFATYNYASHVRKLLDISVLFIGLSWPLLLFHSGCARRGYPEGGLRDSAPPVLLRTSPKYGALNFNKKRVTFLFDENVTLKDADKKFIISPPTQKRPTLMANGKRLRVTFNSPLQDSTTYLLDFENTLVDNNEGNPYKNFKFAFSTGSVLDSLRMEGLAIDAFTNRPVLGSYAFVYLNTDDSVVLTIRPNNIALTDSAGFFVLDNLKGEPYKVVLLSDENKDYKYDIGQEFIGFFDGRPNPALLPVPEQCCHDHDYDHDAKPDVDKKPDASLKSVAKPKRQPQFTIRMFKEEVYKQFLTSATRKEAKAFTLTFNAPFAQVDSLRADSVDFSKVHVEYSPSHDTITYWMADTALSFPDTLKLKFSYLKTDTLNQLSPTSAKQTLTFVKREKASDKTDKKSGGVGGFLKGLIGEEEEVLDTTPKKPANWTLKPMLGFAGVSPIQLATVSFAALLVEVNADKLKFEEVRINPKTKDTTLLDVPFKLVQDTLRSRRYMAVADWKEDAHYRYQVLPCAFIDVYGQTNDTINGRFDAVNIEKTAALNLNFSNVHEQYIVQITNAKGDNILRQLTVTQNGQIVVKYLSPASYGIKIIRDDNQNGRWDTGSYSDHIQPEFAAFLQNTDGKFEFALKQGWDMDLSVDVDVLFPRVADDMHE